jgi:hypothetical protein
MNWVKANKFLTGFIIVMLIGVGVLGYEVFAAASDYDDASTAYATQSAEYNRLRNLSPFPSKQNLAQYEDQKVQAAKAITAFQVDLAKVEFPLNPLSPSAFQDLLKETVTNVRKKASDANVKLSGDKFFLGFEKYETTPPTPESAAPLGRELKAIEWVVNQYIDNHVSDIAPIVRQDLPEERGTRTGGGGGKGNNGGGGKGGIGKGGGPGGPGAGSRARRDLVDYYPFEVTAICKQADWGKILNLITGTKAPQFYVLRQLRIRNQAEKGPPKAKPEAAVADPTKVKDKEYILGEESIEVRAIVDIVDFNAPSDSEGEKAASTEK